MFSLVELANRLGKVDLTPWSNGGVVQPAQQLKATNDWVEAFLGFPESAAVSKGTQLETKESIDKMLKNYAIYDLESGVLATPQGKFEAGWFVCPSVKEIIDTVRSIDGVLKKGRPRVQHVTGVDVGGLIKNGPQFGIYQAASQANGLEMISPQVAPRDGIRRYENDPTQGPRVAMSGGPGTFVRNYWVTQQLGGQFNGLYELNLDHVNGYLIWGTDPSSTHDKVFGQRDKIRIPAMLYTQTVGKAGANYQMNKLVHQIYSYSAPLNAYGNNSNEHAQAIVKTLLAAMYIGTIGLGLILNAWDAARGVKNPINLTFVGAGVFNNPGNFVVGAMKEAIDMFSAYDFDVAIHDYKGEWEMEVRQGLSQYMPGGAGPMPVAGPPFGIAAIPAAGPPFGGPPFGQPPQPVGAPFGGPPQMGADLPFAWRPQNVANLPVPSPYGPPALGGPGTPTLNGLYPGDQAVIEKELKTARAARFTETGGRVNSEAEYADYKYKKYVDIVGKVNIPPGAIVKMSASLPYQMNVVDDMATDTKGVPLKEEICGLGPLYTPSLDPNQNRIFLIFRDKNTLKYSIFKPQLYQLAMIADLYNSPLPSYFYKNGDLQYNQQTGQPIYNNRGQHARSVEAQVFKYLSHRSPIMGYEKEDGSIVYIIDTYYHSNPDDLARPIVQIADASPDPGFKVQVPDGTWYVDPTYIFFNYRRP